MPVRVPREGADAVALPDAEGAERELGYVRALTEGLDGRQARLRERAEEMGREWRAEGYEL